MTAAAIAALIADTALAWTLTAPLIGSLPADVILIDGRIFDTA